MCYNGKRRPLMLLLLVQVCLNSSNETRPSLFVSIAVNIDLAILRAALPDPRLMSRSVGLTRSRMAVITATVSPGSTIPLPSMSYSSNAH